MNQQTQSKLDQEPFLSMTKAWLSEGATNASVVRLLAEEGCETTTDSIRRFRKRHNIGVPTQAKASVKVEGDDAEITTPARPYPHMDDPDKMLEERGLSPEDWVIQGATVNEWDGPKAGGSIVTYHQAKLQLKRRHPEQIVPARADGWIAPPRKERDPGKPELVVITGDQQAPFHDEELHYLFCGWLEANKPARMVALGDKVDFPDISRHRLDPENTAVVNECIQAGYNIFRDYRGASLDTEIDFLSGNHDERIRNVILDNPGTRPLHGLKQANTFEEDGQVAMSLPFLLRLDELGINYHDPHGKYDLAQVNVSEKLAVRHGWIARQGSGASALATLDYLGYSVVVGHTHRQSIIYKTKHDIDGSPSTLTAAEAGCMCRISQETLKGRRFPGFVPAADWQQGFSTATIQPSGLFRIENATYVKHKGKGTLLWRDEAFTA